MARANVPKFGNWENEDNVPYTVYFDKARKTKGGKMINPNDPQENPEMFQTSDPPSHSPPRSKPEEPLVKADAKPSPEDRAYREIQDGRFSGIPPARNENLNQRASQDPSYGANRQKPASSGRPGAGSEHGIDRSPLHPHQPTKGGGRTSGSTYESSQGNPGRTQRKSYSQMGDESPDKAVPVPKFGAWNDSDPQSAENFTDIFNKVREERNAGPGNHSGTPKHPTYVIHNLPPKQPKKCLCFSW